MNHKNLLWSTRGKEWGYRFLHKPEKYSGFSELIYQEIFSTDERIPFKWWGCIHLPGSQTNYVACRFFDPDNRWTDSAGREIPHEMLLFLEDVPANEIVDLDWEFAIFKHARECYRGVYEKNIDEISTPPLLQIDIQIDNISAHISDIDIVTTKHDLDLTTSKRISTFYAGEGKSSLPAHQTIWNILTMDVKEMLGKFNTRGLK